MTEWNYVIIKFFLQKQSADDVDEQMREINNKVDELKKKYGENYGEVVRCIIFHEYILE
jgi:hypothetical protein